MQQDLSSLLKMELDSKNSSIFLVLGKHSDQKNWMAAYLLVLPTNVIPMVPRVK